MKRSSTSVQALSSTPTVILWDVSEEDESDADITYSTGLFTAEEDGNYRFGGYVCVQVPTTQRPQYVVEIYVNGVATGDQRGGSYIRNAGISYDFWTIEFSSEPFALTDGDTVELRVAQVEGATYGYGGTAVGTVRGASSRVWFERIGSYGVAQGMQLGNSSGGTLTANAITTVVTFEDIDVEHPASSIFTFDDANDTIEVDEGGLYSVSYHVWTQTGTLGTGSPGLAFATIRIRADIEVDTGSGFSNPAEALLSIKDVVIAKNSQRHTISNTQIFELSAGDKIRLRSGRNIGTISNTLQLNQCMLAIHKVR